MPRPIPAFLRAAAIALMLAATAAPATAAVTARTAGDLCPPDADPCVVAQTVGVPDASVLDFGLRTLRVEGAGVIDFGAGSATILCGRLEIATSGAALKLRGPTTDGSRGGVATLLVRGRCEAAPATPCFFDADCATAGGACAAEHAAAIVAGSVAGNADRPGRLVVRSAGELRIEQPLSLSSLGASADGGTVELESTLAGLVVASDIMATAGAAGSGGSVELVAATDLGVAARIDASGGDYDGGSIVAEAARDVAVLGELRADATGGAGFGGEIAVAAGRDLRIAGGTAASPLVFSTDGHQSFENIGGDGGQQAWEAGRDLVVASTIRFESNGAAPDGFGDTISFASGGVTLFDGSVVSKARGAFGGGGLVEFAAGGDATFGANAAFELTGPAAGGDWIVESDGAVRTGARVDVSGGVSGVGGRAVAVAEGEAIVGGSWTTSGAATAYSLPELVVEGCTVEIDGALSNAGRGGRNLVTARSRLQVGAPAAVIATGEGGVNEMRRRSSDVPIAVAGHVAPSPSLVFDAALAGCTPCGAAADCDDGVACTVDRCSGARCVHDADAALCDDGEACTADSCTASGCAHDAVDAACEDGDPCTTDDRCSDGTCIAAPSLPTLAATVAMRRGRGAGSDRAKIRLEFPAPLGWDPAATGLRVVVAGEDSRNVLDAMIPANAFLRERRLWGADAGAAPGLARTTLRVTDDGHASALLRFENADLAAMAAAPALRVFVVLGGDPSQAACASGSLLACERRDAKQLCAAPDE